MGYVEIINNSGRGIRIEDDEITEIEIDTIANPIK